MGIDPLENVYTIEAQGARGQVFEPDGTYLTTFGTAGTGDGEFNNPYGIGVGLDRTVYVAEHFNHRISKWNVTVPTELSEIAGPNRYATAVAASEAAFADGSASMAVIATGENWPDAMGGAALAGAADAPLLLTAKNYLPPEVKAEIIRLGVNYIYILGSEDAVSAAVYNELAAMTPMMMNRLWGPSRYETANAIADETVSLLGSDYDGTAFVATGENFPDALAASPIAAANGWPIYLTPKVGLSALTKTAMVNNGSNHGYILGSESALAEAVETELNAAPFVGFDRLGGGTRYETGAIIAELGFEGLGMLWSRPAIAVGDNFPDALAGGVLQGSDYSVLLLTPPTGLDPFTADLLTTYRDSIYELRFLGSTKAVPQPVRDAATALLH